MQLMSASSQAHDRRMSLRLDFLDGAVCLAGCGAVAPPSFSHASMPASESPFFVEMLISLLL